MFSCWHSVADDGPTWEQATRLIELVYHVYTLVQLNVTKNNNSNCVMDNKPIISNKINGSQDHSLAQKKDVGTNKTDWIGP